MKKTFQTIYKATEEAAKAVKKPLVFARNKRAVESAINSAEEQLIDAEEQLDIALSVVSAGKVIDVKEVLSCRKTMKDAQATIDELTEFKDSFFADEDEDDAPAKKEATK